MKVNRVFLAATVAAISAVAVSSCAYDPYYSGSPYSSRPSYASGYGSSYGYGSGYGYGGRNFTTTFFVSTGHSRWGYDPYARCYYDYSRRCYYDPYLYGYYPLGYRPTYVQGAPHPHGWRSGSSYIAPPSRIYDQKLDNYQNRTERYRSLNTDWSRNIQVKQTRESNPYHDRRTSSQSYLGSSNQGDPRSRSYDRSHGTYVREVQSPRYTESRMFDPRQSSRSSRTEYDESHTRSTRQVGPKPEREGLRNESVKPEVMRQPEIRGGNRSRIEKKAPIEQPAINDKEIVGESL